MAFQVINTVAQPAFKGANVMVTFSSTQASVYNTQFVRGQIATVSSSGKTGTVDRIDLYGTSISVKPTSPASTFDSIQPGYLSVNEIITIS